MQKNEPVQSDVDILNLLSAMLEGTNRHIENLLKYARDFEAGRIDGSVLAGYRHAVTTAIDLRIELLNHVIAAKNREELRRRPVPKVNHSSNLADEYSRKVEC